MYRTYNSFVARSSVIAVMSKRNGLVQTKSFSWVLFMNCSVTIYSEKFSYFYKVRRGAISTANYNSEINEIYSTETYCSKALPIACVCLLTITRASNKRLELLQASHHSFIMCNG